MSADNNHGLKLLLAIDLVPCLVPSLVPVGV